MANNIKRGNPVMDALDTFVFGPLNFIDHIGYVLGAIRKRSWGHRFKLVRADKWNGDSPPMNYNQARKLLKDRGVLPYGPTHDANYMYFSVSHRQAQWAEYILLSAGAGEQLCNPTKQHSKNQGWASKRTGAPPAWKHRQGARQSLFSKLFR